MVIVNNPWKRVIKTAQKWTLVKEQIYEGGMIWTTSYEWRRSKHQEWRRWSENNAAIMITATVSDWTELNHVHVRSSSQDRWSASGSARRFCRESRNWSRSFCSVVSESTVLNAVRFTTPPPIGASTVHHARQKSSANSRRNMQDERGRASKTTYKEKQYIGKKFLKRRNATEQRTWKTASGQSKGRTRTGVSSAWYAAFAKSRCL